MKTKRTLAFSLIELLIVVTIIMILAGLLLPALRQVRERAKAVACLSNMRQIGVMLNLYEQDYNGYPSFSPVYGSYSCTEFGYGGQQGIAAPTTNCSDGGGSRPFDERPLNRYMIQTGSGTAKPKVYQCPSDIGIDWGVWGVVAPSQWIAYGTSYEIPRYGGCDGTWGGNESPDIGSIYCWDGSRLKGFRRSQLVAPARKIALMEGQMWYNSTPCTSKINQRHWVNETQTLHRKAHVVFADGSARFLIRDKGVAGHGSCGTPTAWATNANAPDPSHDWY